MTSTATRVASDTVQLVLGKMARAMLGADDARRVGEFALRPEQREAVRRAELALQESRGVLIADAPGTGKTVLALAVAASYEDVLVIVPAAIREQWQRAALKAGIAARFETIEGLSQGRVPRGAALVIVDEAHQLRTPTTVRYRAVAQLAMQCHLLLLTATPVVNSLRDRDALLALFMGERAAQLSDSVRGAVILRLASGTESSSRVERLPPLAAQSNVQGLAQALARLPPPLPLADGAEASAIVRLTLAFAWASSLAALDVALKRRIERGRTLDDQLAAGRWPNRDELRAWILGDDATQLAFGFDAPNSESVPGNAREVLGRHLAAVAALRLLVRPQVLLDTAQRAQSLKALLADHPQRRVLLLAQSAVTVRALYAALRTEAGVVSIAGNSVKTAAGRWTRDEVLAALGPGARSYDPRDPHGIRLLLATDILAEGVELQAASILVHADPTWTPARREQRLGRIAREGQRERVLVTEFAIPPEAEAMLQMRARLQRKASARVLALRASGTEAELTSRLQHLARAQGDGDASPRVAAVVAPRCGFIVLLRDGGEYRLVAGERRGGRWQVCSAAPDVLRALEHALPRGPLSSELRRERGAEPSGGLRPALINAMHLTRVRRVLHRWHRGQQAAALAVDETALPESILLALRGRLDAGIAGASLQERPQRAREVCELLMQISTLRGQGAEQTLKQLLRSSPGVNELMVQLRELSAASNSRKQKRPAPLAGTGRLGIEALILLVGEPKAPSGSGPALP